MFGAELGGKAKTTVSSASSTGIVTTSVQLCCAPTPVPGHAVAGSSSLALSVIPEARCSNAAAAVSNVRVDPSDRVLVVKRDAPPTEVGLGGRAQAPGVRPAKAPQGCWRDTYSVGDFPAEELHGRQGTHMCNGRSSKWNLGDQSSRSN